MLRVRLAAAAVLLPGAVAWVLLAPLPLYAAIAGILILAAAWEWAGLAGYRSLGARLAYLAAVAVLLALGWWGLEAHALREWLPAAFTLYWIAAAAELWRGPVRAPRVALGLQGLLVLSGAWFAFVVVRAGSRDGRWLVLALLAAVWAADAGAYFCGRAWGRHRLAPRLSPSKTWEGLAGGLLAAALAGLIASLWTPLRPGVLVLLALACAVLSVVGDLAESRLKRAAGAKDSSHLIPGHGGLLDRIDSLTAAAPIFAVGLSLVGATR